MDLKRRPDSLLLAFILFSLLLHVVVLLLLPQRDLFPLPSRPEPLVVEMRPPPPPRQRELDLPPREAETPRETPARRLGPSDQVVKKETAPKGADTEDRRPSPPPPPRPAPPAVARAPQPVPQPPPAVSAPPAPVAPVRPQPDSPRMPTPRPEPETAEQPPQPARPPLPDLKTLTELPSTTVTRLERQWEKEWRQKYRPEVEDGNTYWLDTEKDILISFFRRFREQIYAVWSYPPKARERMQEGTCLLKVTVNRDGTLRDVQVMESSGSPLLDDEAVAAVRKGAPFGELHSAYQEETLSIFAFFQYNLTRVNLRRPGNIY